MPIPESLNASWVEKLNTYHLPEQLNDTLVYRPEIYWSFGMHRVGFAPAFQGQKSEALHNSSCG